MKSLFKIFLCQSGNSNKRCDIPGYLISNPGLKHMADQIFGYLDIKTIGKCRFVSKQWRQFLEKLWNVKQVRQMSECIYIIEGPFTCTFRCTFLFLLSSYLHPLSQPYASFQGCFVQGPTWILARYQTGHVINQLEISSIILWTTNQKAV